MIFSAEHIILFVIVLFIFGPRALPGIGTTLGKVARNLRDGLGGVKEPQYTKLGETVIKDKNTRDSTS